MAKIIGLPVESWEMAKRIERETIEAQGIPYTEPCGNIDCDDCRGEIDCVCSKCGKPFILMLFHSRPELFVGCFDCKVGHVFALATKVKGN